MRSGLESLAQDVRLGVRLLLRSPLATAFALLSLTLGIGANTALFSLTDALLLRTLPVTHPEQLYQFQTQSPKPGSRPSRTLTNPLWEQIRDHQDIFTAVIAWTNTSLNLESAGEAHNARGIYVSGGYFPELGVKPLGGRLIGVADDQRGCPAVADISEGFWRSHFGGSHAAVGSKLRLEGVPFEVIGIVPAHFYGVTAGNDFEVAVPICAEAALRPAGRSLLDERAGWWLNVIGRLPPGVSTAAATTRLQTLAPQWLQATIPPSYNATNVNGYVGRRFSLVPASHGNASYIAALALRIEVLLAVAGIVLLIACANLAGLILAHVSARRSELAIRLALGASRARLVRQLLTECLLLSLGGAGLGSLFAVWMCRAIQRTLNGDRNVLQIGAGIDLRVLAFTVGLALVTGMLIGLLPALRSTRVSLAAEAQATARGTQVSAHVPWIVSIQVALSIVLLAGAALFLRSLIELNRLNPGFDAERVILVRVLAPRGPATAQPIGALRARYAAALGAIRALPGVVSASQSFTVPINGLEWDNAVEVAGSASASIPDAMLNSISPGYFATLRTALLAGRDFSESDSATSTPVAIVNQSAVRELFPNGSALGQRISEGEPPDLSPPAVIVGIVADQRWDSLRGDAPPAAFFPATQSSLNEPTATFELRSALPLADLAPQIRAVLGRTMPDAGFQLQSFAQMVADSIITERLLGEISALFGLLALLLTAIGLFGVTSYSATRRRKEWGIRIALGARPGSVIALALRDSARLVVAGILAGALLTWALARVLQHTLSGMLFGVRAGDGLTLALAAVTLSLVSLGAAYAPARRAGRVDPMATLREE